MNQKTPLLLLHGALGSADQLAPLAECLQDQFKVHCFTFSGHGGKGDLQQLFSIENFALELEQWLQANGLRAIPVFGYSMGGYVALYLAQYAADYFTRIITLGTKFAWSAQAASHEVQRLHPAVVAEKLPLFAQMLAKRHHPHDWRTVMEKTAGMMLALGERPMLTREALAGINIPVTIMRGSEDRMVSSEESQQAVNWLPQATYKTLIGQPHSLEQLNLEMLQQEIRHTLNSGR